MDADCGREVVVVPRSRRHGTRPSAAERGIRTEDMLAGLCVYGNIPVNLTPTFQAAHRKARRLVMGGERVGAIQKRLSFVNEAETKPPKSA